MISAPLHTLAMMLRLHPHKADAIADRIEELAREAALIEASVIPPHLRGEAPANGVVRMADRRRPA